MTARAATPAIEVRDLRKTYAGGVEALKGISFSAAPGEVLGLLGPNGAGKSTTVRILATLSDPDGGTARVAGHDVGSDPQAVRRSLGYVSQDSAVDPTATARENLLLQGRLQRMGSEERRRRADELLEAFGLEEDADREVRDFSGGMKRRLDVATGVLHRPRVLCLDEPTTGLDPEIRRTLWRELERLTVEESLTVLLTTHYMEEADRLADRVAILDEGEIVARGAPEELKDSVEGDRVTVELEAADAAGRAGEVLRGLEEVREVVGEGATLHARVGAGAPAVPAVLGALEREGIDVHAVSLARPSLEDVYLRATGHTFEEADRAEGEAGP